MLLPNATFKFLRCHPCLISIFFLFFSLFPLNSYYYWNLSPVFPASSRWKSFLSTPRRWQGPLCSHTNKQFRSSYPFTPVVINPVLCFRVIIYFFIWIESVMLPPPGNPPSLSLPAIHSSSQPSVLFCVCSDSSSLLRGNPFLRVREQEGERDILNGDLLCVEVCWLYFPRSAFRSFMIAMEAEVLPLPTCFLLTKGYESYRCQYPSSSAALASIWLCQSKNKRNFMTTHNKGYCPTSRRIYYHHRPNLCEDGVFLNWLILLKPFREQALVFFYLIHK